MTQIHRPRRLDVRLSGGSYPIHVTPEGLAGLGQIAAPWGGIPSALVTDAHVDALHGEAARNALRAAGVPHECFVLPAGEATKSQGQLADLLERLLAAGVPREGAVFALGGGVIGDLAGLAASLLRRGVACVQIPTTLIGQVDSAIGGKTAINSAHGKNLIGTFHQPTAVFAAAEVLSTLPDEELRAGMGEVLKYGLLDGDDLLAQIHDDAPAILARDPAVLAQLVERCAAIKARIVEADEREGGVRRWLNLGHTVGHAVEHALGYGTWRHGEAVAVGLVAICELSADRGLADDSLADRVRGALSELGLPIRAEGLRRGALRAALTQDKKASAREIHWVMLRGVGDPQVVPEDLSRVDGILALLERKGVLGWSTP